MTPEQRRAYQRERYHSNLAAERLRKAKEAKDRYHEDEAASDPEDYAEEFEFSTIYLNMSARSIISGSLPGRDWFYAEVLPRVSHARCGTCGRYYIPAISGYTAECSPACLSDYVRSYRLYVYYRLCTPSTN